MKNTSKGSAHTRHFTAILRAIEQTRGPVDLNELEHDLAESEDKYWSTDSSEYLFAEPEERQHRHRSMQSTKKAA